MPGGDLGKLLYSEGVRPILERRFPHLVHSAGLLGTGSDALGFDTPQSMDHHWGPRLWLFLMDRDDDPQLLSEIDRRLGYELPLEVGGFPTHFADAETHGGHMAHAAERPIRHMVFVTTVRRFCKWYLGINPLDHELTPAEWLSIPEQSLRTVTSGAVYHDGSGELKIVRDLLQWYPHDVWLYVLAAQWRRVAQEEAFVGRCGQVGDELGSRVVAARLVRELMHLCLLMERRYAPYSKWFGTAFGGLSCAPKLAPLLTAALAADDWHAREAHLCRAYTVVAEMHNALNLTEHLPTEASQFYGRPFQVIYGDRFADALAGAIEDEIVRGLPPHVGSINQWADSTDVLSYPAWYERLRPLYSSTP